ncbi:hypothetical protein ACH4E7_27025 [Kitasatospora sp. NPDC018058]|uniref:hypothetical protein n=1 Tax=Kitasatospora sp. NPDC018058 TaxID=3364025 RepID=UPI0037BE67BC
MIEIAGVQAEPGGSVTLRFEDGAFHVEPEKTGEKGEKGEKRGTSLGDWILGTGGIEYQQIDPEGGLRATVRKPDHSLVHFTAPGEIGPRLYQAFDGLFRPGAQQGTPQAFPQPAPQATAQPAPQPVPQVQALPGGYGQPNPYGQYQQPNPYGQPNQPNPYGQYQQPNPYGQPGRPNPYGDYGQPNQYRQG